MPTHLYAGFLAGLSSSLLLQPLDLLKTRLQQSPNTTLWRELQRTPILKLWRGTLPLCIRTSVGSGLYLASLNSIRKAVATPEARARAQANAASAGTALSLPKLTMTENLLAGAVARSFVGFLTMPVTILKIRYESATSTYQSLGAAVKDVSRGGIQAFFKGYWVTTARDAPNAGIYILFYEWFKAMGEVSGAAPVLVNGLSAFSASCVSSVMTAPFDTIKTRIQLGGGTAREVLTQILRQERFRNLFDGLSMRLARKGMSAGIAWCMYEELVRERAPTKLKGGVLEQ